MIGHQLGYVPQDNLQTRLRRRLNVLLSRIRYRLRLPEPDLGEVDISEDFYHPIDLDQLPHLLSQYRELFPEAVRTELAEARRLAAHRFTFLGHTMNFDKQIPWFRDPVSGREWSRGFSPDIPYRGPKRLGDIKLPWELSKHQYFFTLGKAAWLTDDPTLSNEIVRQIDQWIEDNPYHRGINWISALEVGMRAISWIMAYPFYADRCDAHFRRRLASVLALHILFVEGHLATGRFANNHLIGEAAALVVGGLFLDCRQSRRWLQKGLTLLEEEMGRQVTDDGVHAERSILYHRFILDHYHLVNGLLISNGRKLPEVIRQGMERMTEFLMDVIYPDGSVPTFGDGDDARGLWFRADCPADYRSLLALGAVLFGRGDFKTAAGGPTEEILWLLGIEGVDKFQELTAHPPDHTSTSYADGGYYIMRGGWDASDSVLIFDCGPLGYGPAGHGHADALSFQIFADGYPFFVDSGTYSYNLDYAWRDAFRSTRAHNSVVVDGQDQSIPGDRMSWETMASAKCNLWQSNRWFDLADGEHDGFRRLRDPVAHRRIILFLKPDTWLIWDLLRGSNHHDFEFLLHLRPDCGIEAEPGGTGLNLISPEGRRVYTRMMGGNGDIILPEILVGSDKERAAWFSPVYGTRVKTSALRIRREFAGNYDIIACFSTSNHLTHNIIEREDAIRVDTRREGGRTESLFYRVNDDQRLEEDSVRFDGVLFYRLEAAGSTPIVLADGFRELSVAGLVDVRSPVPIDSLLLANGCCELVLPSDHVDGLQFSARERVRLVINGQSAPIGAMAI